MYRDGAALAPSAETEWWDAPDTARVVVLAGRYADANETGQRLFNLTVDELIGRSAGDLTLPDSRVDQDWLWQRLRDTGRLHGLSMIRPLGGDPIRVEFLTVMDGDGPGRHATFLREVVPA